MRIYNTMTGKKEDFVPVNPGQVQNVRVRYYGL